MKKKKLLTPGEKMVITKSVEDKVCIVCFGYMPRRKIKYCSDECQRSDKEQNKNKKKEKNSAIRNGLRIIEETRKQYEKRRIQI